MAVELQKLTVNASNGSFTFEVVDADARDLAQQALDAAGSSSGGDCNIQRIESESSNYVYLRDLASGLYVLYGYFRPFNGSGTRLVYDNVLASVAADDTGSHILTFDTVNSKVNFVEVLVDDKQTSGFYYNRTAISLLDLHGLIAKIGDMDGLSTTEKSTLVAAINEVAANAGGSDGGENLNPVSKTEEMTQPVGADGDGKLWTAPSSGGTAATVTAEKAFAASVLDLNRVAENQYLAKHNTVMFEATADTTLKVGGDNLIGEPYSGSANVSLSKTVTFVPVDGGYSLDYDPDYTGTKTFQNQRFGFLVNIVSGKTYTLRFEVSTSSAVYLYLATSADASGTLIGSGNINSGGLCQITFAATADYTHLRLPVATIPTTITGITLCEGDVPLEPGGGSTEYVLTAGEKVWLTGVRSLNCVGSGVFYESPLAITAFNGIATADGSINSCATDGTYVNMGDSIWTFGANTGGIGNPSDYMRTLCGGTWHNIATGGTTMASRPGNYAGAYDALDFWRLADAIVAGDYTDAKAAAAELTSNFANIDSVDWAAVDYITVAYGTNDLAFGAEIDNEANLLDTATICGALRYGIKAINGKYPNIRFKVLGLLYRNADATPAAKIVECNNALREAANYMGAEYVDGYGINGGNHSTFLYDGTHPNAAGKARIAETLAQTIHAVRYR